MNIKKLSAAVIAAAVLAVAAPMTGVLPDQLSVVASAAEYKAGDFFGVAMNPETGETFGEATDVMTAHQISSEEFGNGAVYDCQVLDDGTIRVYTYCMGNEFIHQGKKITIPTQIGGYTVTEIGGTSEDSHCVGGFSSITIPDTVKTINQAAFVNNFMLEEIKFGENSQLTLIDQWAFQDCRSLSSITIPANVEIIAYDAFCNSPLDSSYFPFKMIGKDFSNVYSLTEVNFAEESKLKTIGEFAFSNQKSLTSIAIPESTDSIAKNAFEGSALKNIDGVAGSYAETFAKENSYTFNGKTFEKPDDTSEPTDTSDTFTDNSGDKAADIEVIAKPNVIPKEAHFSVRLDDKNTTAERIAYNCYFTYNGAEYEPTDTVTVRIPVPVAMRDIADTLKVYHLQDGKYVNMSAKVENGYLVFDTDHFSVYVVTAENLENGGTSTPTTSDTTSSTPTASDTSSSAPTSSDTASSAPTTSDKGNPDTGVTAIAVTAGAAALAGAIVLIAHKKRK